ncbi:MAG: hypothetical protein IK080_00850 [Clostridia bacterium]|nr:hypothetical protein [Clostridia bacterium]
MKPVKRLIALLLAATLLLSVGLQAFALDDAPATGQCGWTAAEAAQEEPAAPSAEEPETPETPDTPDTPDTPEETVVCYLTPEEFEQYRAAYVDWRIQNASALLKPTGAELLAMFAGPFIALPMFFIPFVGPLASGVLLAAPFVVPIEFFSNLFTVLNMMTHKKDIAAEFTERNLYAIPQPDGSFEIGFKYATTVLHDGECPVAVIA